MSARKHLPSLEDAEIISHVAKLLDPVEVLHHLLKVVESGNYQIGDWWVVEYDNLTKDYVELACPMTRVEWIYFKKVFDTEELDGRIYWRDTDNDGVTEENRFPSPREVAEALFDYRFIPKFVDLIDNENKYEAISLIKQEIARIQVGKGKVVRGLYKCYSVQNDLLKLAL